MPPLRQRRIVLGRQFRRTHGTESRRRRHNAPTAVVFYGAALEVAAILFNAVWEYARHGDRLLHTIDAVGVNAISWRFRLALAWIATGTLLGGLLPVLGMVVIAAFIPFYWWPIPGEIASAKPRRDGRGQVPRRRDYASFADPGRQHLRDPGNRLPPRAVRRRDDPF